jgi:hypothetical protein
LTIPSRQNAAQDLAVRLLRSSADSVEELEPELWARLFRKTPEDATEFERQQDLALRLLAESLRAVGYLTTGLTLHTEEAATACFDLGEKTLRSPIIRHLDHCPGHPTGQAEEQP